MVRAQNLRLASLILSHCRQRQRQRHHHWGCCLMAAASSASSSLFQARSFPNLNRTKHCFQFLSLSYSLSSSSSASSLSIGSSFVLTVCCSEKRTVNGSNNNCINNSVSHNSDSLRKAWAFDPRLPNLIRDSEIGPQDSCNPSLIDSQEGRNHRGRSPGFRDGPPLPEKIVVAVDVDEVLGNFVSALNRFIADRYSLIHSVSEYHVYEFFKIWNCSRDEADIRVHEFFKTPYFKMGIHPIPGARQALHKLSRFCTLSIVTSRQNAIKDHTIEWIEKHYPGLFQDIHFGNHFALDGQSRPKSDICRSLGAKVLIDDNPRYAIECAEAGIRVLLFDYEDSYPWCKTEAVNQHPLVTKVNNWEEVEQNLLSWVVS